MLQRQNNFADIDSYFVLGKMFPLIQMRKQLAAADIICKKAKFSFNLGLDNINIYFFFFIYHRYSSTRYWAMKYSLIKRLRAGFGIQSCSLANEIYLKYFLNIFHRDLSSPLLWHFLISLV